MSRRDDDCIRANKPKLFRSTEMLSIAGPSSRKSEMRLWTKDFRTKDKPIFSWPLSVGDEWIYPLSSSSSSSFCLIFEGLWESGEEEEEVLKYLRIRKKISFDTGINQVEKGEKRREAAACCTVDYLHRRSSVSLSEGAHRLLAYFPAHVSSFFLSLRFRWFTQTAVSWEYVKLYYMTCIVTYFL